MTATWTRVGLLAFAAAVVACKTGPGARCRLQDGRLTVGEKCVAVDRDPEHCGGAGLACEKGQVCTAGMCAPAGTLAQKPADPGVWLDRGPFYSGRLSAIVASDASHLWVGTPGGSVWKSSDGGRTFTRPLNYGLGDYTVLALAFDRLDPTRLYMRTWNGVWVSGDGAEHWTRLLYTDPGIDSSYPYASGWCGDDEPCPAQGLMVEPQPFTQMVVAPGHNILLDAQPCDGLSYSLDGGTTWRHVWLFPSEPGTPPPHLNPDNCVVSLAGDEATGRVYLGTQSAPGGRTGVFRSTAPWTAAGPPSPLQWEHVGTGFPNMRMATTLAWAGAPHRVFTVVADGDAGSGAQPYVFDGATWTARPFNNPACGVGYDPRSLVWGGAPGVPSDELFVGGSGSFAYTGDAGLTWSCPNLSNQHGDVRGVFASRSAGRVWNVQDQSDFATHDVIASYPWRPGAVLDAGSGLTGAGIASWQLYSVGVPAPASPTAPRRVFIGPQDTGAACSDDGGRSWRYFMFQIAPHVPPGETQAIAVHPTGNVAYFWSTQITLKRSSNAGTLAPSCAAVTFTDVTPPDTIRVGAVVRAPHTLALHPRDPAMVYLLALRGVMVSDHQGDPGSWRLTQLPSGGAARPPLASSLFVDDAGALYVGTMGRGAFVCADSVHQCDGSPGSGAWASWALNGPSPAPPHAIMAIASSGGAFFIATSQGVYRRLPGGSWTVVSPTTNYVYSDVVVDPTCPSRIYSAVGYLGDLSRSRGGVQVSTQHGDPGSWTSLSAGWGLHNSPVSQITVDAAAPQRLYASTYGAGVWEYSWGSAPPPCVP